MIPDRGALVAEPPLPPEGGVVRVKVDSSLSDQNGKNKSKITLTIVVVVVKSGFISLGSTVDYCVFIPVRYVHL